MKKFQIHFIDIDTNEHLLTAFSYYIPVLKSEIRYTKHGEQWFAKVKQLVYVYDEPECLHERINVGVKSIHARI